MVIDNLKAEAKKRHDDFISKRSLWENKINKFIEGAKAVDPAILAELTFDISELEPHKLMPSLYAEPFNHATYLQEKERADKLVGEINAIRDRLMSEAAKELGINA